MRHYVRLKQLWLGDEELTTKWKSLGNEKTLPARKTQKIIVLKTEPQTSHARVSRCQLNL